MPSQIIKLYEGKVEIEFKESPHSYYLLGEKKKRLCGVTTFISVLDKPALIPWAVGVTVDYIRNNIDQLKSDPSELLKLAREEANNQKDIASEIGKAIHGWIEAHIKGKKPDMPEDLNVMRGVTNFLSWVEMNEVEFIASERIVYSAAHEYVGTLDILARVNGEMCLIDIKTGNGIYAEVKMQTEAYRRAFIEETGQHIAGRWVWRISKHSEAEHNARQNAKKGGTKVEYVPFEAIYLDEDMHASQRDFDGFLACKQLYRWKQVAEKELAELR